METVSQLDNQSAPAGKRKAAQGWMHVRFEPDVRRLLRIRAAELGLASVAEAVRVAVHEWLGKAA